MKRRKKKLLPIVLVLSMLVSMINPVMAMPVYAKDKTVTEEAPTSNAENPDVSEKNDAVSEDVAEQENNVKPKVENKQDVTTEETEKKNDGTLEKDGKDASPSAEEVRVVVKINDRDYSVNAGEELEDVISKNFGETLSDITSVEFVSGKITENDLKYFSAHQSDLTKLAILKVNLDTDLTFTGGTVLPHRCFDVGSGLKSLTTVELGGFTEIGSQAMQIEALTNVSIPDVTTIDSWAFTGCENLESIDLTGVTTIKEMAFEETGLISVSIPDVTTMGYRAFSKCKELQSIDMPNITEISEDTFRDCKKLSKVNMPNVIAIGENAFDNCDAFTEISLPKVESIANMAFSSVDSVVHVTIGTENPPKLVGTPFANVKTGSTITVPEGCLPNYLPYTEIGALYSGTGELTWGGRYLQVVDNAYVTVHYTDTEKYPIERYQILAKGQPIGEEAFAVTRNGYQLGGIYKDSNLSEPAVDGNYVPEESGFLYFKWDTITVSVANAEGGIVDTIELPTDTYNMLVYNDINLYPELPEGAFQWNTKQDGSGQTILGSTKIYHDITLYPIFEDITNITVKVNDKEYTGATLALAVEKANADTITSLEVVSGKITNDDFKWMDDAVMKTAESFIIRKGVDVENKTLPGGTATSAPNLKYLELHGVEVIKTAALSAKKLNTVILPDVKVVGDNGLGTIFDTAPNDEKIKKLEMPNVEQLGRAVFRYQNQIGEFNFPKLKSIGDDCFGGCGDFRLITEQIPDIGQADSQGAFGKNPSKNAVLVVPAQVYDDYVKKNGNDKFDKIHLERGEEAPAATIVKINGTDVSGASLEDAVTKSGVDVESLTSLEFVSGVVTQSDLDYVAELTYLESFTMNVGENLTLQDKNGNATTVLGTDGATLKFADAPSGWSKPAIRDVVLGGITEIQDGGLKAISVETIEMPNVVTVGDNAFFGLKWLEKLNLDKAETVGKNAFRDCVRLKSLTMNSVKTLKDGSFGYTDALTKLTLPESIETIESIEFGKVYNGNKNGTKIVLNKMTPPEVAGDAFKGVASSGTYSTITVPQGALAAYVKEIDSQADTTGVLKKDNIIWKGLWLREEGSHLVEYQIPGKQYLVQFAFVKEGNALTKGQVATVDEKEIPEDSFLAGWNTKKDGTGDTVGEGTVLKSDVVVYPVWGKNVITANIDGNPFSGATLEDAVAKSGIDADDVTSLEFVSGVITQDDLKYIKDSMKHLETLKMNLNENLQLTDDENAVSTTLPSSALKGTRLETVEIGGITVIESRAFEECTSLESVSMPNVEEIGSDAFYHTDVFENITLPESIKTLNSCGFGVAKNGKKTLHVHMEGTVPPTVKGSVFSKAEGDSYVEVPTGSLQNYLSDLDLSKHFGDSGETMWASLRVVDAGYHFLEFKGINSWDRRYAYVKDGEQVTEDRIPEFKNEGYVLAGWNTEKDGTGTAVDANTVPTESMVLYAQWEEKKPDVITVNIDGNPFSGASLEDAVAKSGIDADDVTSLEFVSGVITQDDLKYIKDSMKHLETLKMNLNENLQLTDDENAVSTTLPSSAFKGTRLETVEIGGITVIESRAFEECTSLESVSMPNVEEIGSDAFYHTDAFENITLPESIKTLNDCGFGVAKNGKKTLHVHMEGTVPPTVKGSVFSKAEGDSYVEVPTGSLQNYLSDLDLSKHFGDSGETMWASLRVVDPGYHFLEFKGINSWDRRYAYVKDGEQITEDRIPEFKNEGYVLAGWNTEKDGTGTAVDANTVPTESMILYAQWNEEVPVVLDKAQAENGKVVVSLKEAPTYAPTQDEMTLQMDLNGTGNKEVAVKEFSYDGDKTITLTFEPIAQTDKEQKFTMTVTWNDQEVVSNEVVIEAKKDDGGNSQVPGGSDKPGTPGNGPSKPGTADKAVKTGDTLPSVPFLFGITLLAAAAIVGVGITRRKRTH